MLMTEALERVARAEDELHDLDVALVTDTLLKDASRTVGNVVFLLAVLRDELEAAQRGNVLKDVKIVGASVNFEDQDIVLHPHGSFEGTLPTGWKVTAL